MLTDEALAALMPAVCQASSMVFRSRLVIISPLQATALLVDTLVSLMGVLLHSSFTVVPTPFHDADAVQPAASQQVRSCCFPWPLPQGLPTRPGPSQHARTLHIPCLPTADPRFWGELKKNTPLKPFFLIWLCCPRRLSLSGLSGQATLRGEAQSQRGPASARTGATSRRASADYGRSPSGALTERGRTSCGKTTTVVAAAAARPVTSWRASQVSAPVEGRVVWPLSKF